MKFVDFSLFVLVVCVCALCVCGEVTLKRYEVEIGDTGMKAIHYFPEGEEVNVTHLKRIVGGEMASPNEFPSLARLSLGGYLCSGTIISKRTILTASHCVEGIRLNRMTARLGITSCTEQGTTIAPSAFVMHPNYNTKTLANDVALLLFDSDLFEDGNPKISSVPMNVDTQSIATGQPCTTSGWGTTSSGGSISCDLLKVDVKYQSCSSLVQAKYTVTKGMICAGDIGKDACQGDSGGPLYSVGENRKVTGIVSWGIGCAHARFPGVYTDVSYFQPWVLSKWAE